ncbi:MULTISPECIES: ABC transporter substrate-binding protein [Halomonadaceae]|jgi:trehalose/maltose transport system substrate-binding protein|uniref:ABC transporter substrate-binding protein n=1 Tax=Halomonadaceae TaxID=28256 RepID=UPI001583EE4A|nr:MULTISPECIES: ABC transporter substrate-binding protein [Halomonas]MDI4638067.1 ABC transporter substrate-binding protein [Halomonas sp. BMC7]NUJ59069.1 ABC transporter substrate-binding protein [Halomonas taeanensis]|tara:strand:- start:1424 stop:2692 length:1269 start_codon:yes stop_codon:yes gene_type:complete
MRLLKGGAVALLLSGATLATPQVLATEISIACGAGDSSDYCPALAEQWAEKTGNTVNIITTPNDPTEKLSLYQQLLGSQSSDVDVLLVDIVWPGLLDDHLVDLYEYLPADITEDFFPALVDNNTIDGRLVAMPWYTDAGLLYYRKDLLEKYGYEVPQTWQELTDTAEAIQAAEREAGNADFWGYTFQGRAYEGLTCNALEWVASHGGGTIVDGEGEVTIDNPQAAAALDLAASWIGTISPEGALNHTEEETRGIFQSGNALFLRNWPYVWALANSEGSEVAGKIGMASLPHGPKGESKATLGGWNVAVSRYSEHPALAADLAAYITAEPQQKAHAVKMGRNPTIESLYQDEQVLASNPSMRDLYETLVNGVPRPASVTGDAYARVSNAFFNRTHQVLSGDLDGASAVQQLSRELERLSRRGW